MEGTTEMYENLREILVYCREVMRTSCYWVIAWNVWHVLTCKKTWLIAFVTYQKPFFIKLKLYHLQYIVWQCPVIPFIKETFLGLKTRISTPVLHVNVRDGFLSVFQLLKYVFVYNLEKKERAGPSILSLLLLMCVFQFPSKNFLRTLLFA